MAFLNIINHLKENTSKIISEKGYDNVNFVVEYSRSGFGDITCNVAFLLAKNLKKNPQEIAQEFAGEYNLGNDLEKVEAHKSGYLNFFINTNSFNNTVLPESLKENYGSVDIGKNSKLIVEHTSVNPNKALHIGHLRNVAIGDAVSRILSKANYDVKVLNYIDDSGLQVADIIVGFKYGGFSESPLTGEKFADYCGDTVYVSTTSKYESDKDLESKRHEILKELEDPTSDTAKFGKTLTRKILSDQLDTVWNFGASYDCLNFESEILYSKLWEKICEFGKANDFDVIITLQPIAGFGNKVLTNQELKYAQTGEDYTNNLLIESSSIYQNYAKNLSEITTCTKTFDIRNVFDTESEPIYWDQGHVSDRGNSIVAKSLSNTIFYIVSENNEFNTFETVKDIKKTSSSLYDDREIVVMVQMLSSNESDNEQVKISTYDNTNKEDIQNVTYFLAISKDNENILREYFFAKDGILIFDVFPNDSNQVQVLGKQQYDHNAYVMSDVTPLEINGPIFSKDGTYTFDIELRTIDDPENWVFSLSGFHSEITIKKDTTFQETFTEDKSSLQTEDFFRKIFSYYKTSILLNEIFK